MQLDHVSDLFSVERAVRCGLDAVMAEGSKLSFPDNLAFTCAAASIHRTTCVCSRTTAPSP
jgi:fructose/tagatose bisphosphate aldolase